MKRKNKLHYYNSSLMLLILSAITMIVDKFSNTSQYKVAVVMALCALLEIGLTTVELLFAYHSDIRK